MKHGRTLVCERYNSTDWIYMVHIKQHIVVTFFTTKFDVHLTQATFINPIFL